MRGKEVSSKVVRPPEMISTSLFSLFAKIKQRGVDVFVLVLSLVVDSLAPKNTGVWTPNRASAGALLGVLQTGDILDAEGLSSLWLRLSFGAC